MEKEMQIEDLYTELDESYDKYAKDIMLLLKEMEQIQSHINKIDAKIQQEYLRLQLYIQNEFWMKYSIKKHSFLLLSEPENKLVLFPQKELTEINALYDDIGDSDFDIESELAELFNDDFDFSSIAEDEQTKAKKKIKFVNEHIKNREFEAVVNSKQRATLEQITRNYKNLLEKKTYLNNRKQEANDNYMEIIDDVTNTLVEDENYNFNPEEDSLMTVKLTDSSIWKFIYYNEDNLELLDQIVDIQN